MTNQHAWLRGEIERWKRSDLISPQQAEKIRALYPLQKESPWGLILFCSFGAAIVGLGIILLIAHNWSAIPRLGKVSIIVAATALAHGAGIVLRGKEDCWARVAEALFLLGTMLFGAGIWLVAQAYNIDEHFPNGFLLWGIGALALSWVIQSIPQAIAAIVLLTTWGMCEGVTFHSPESWALAMIIVGVGPLLVLKRSGILAAVWLSAIYLLIFTNAAFYGGEALGFTSELSLSVLLIAIARWLQASPRFPGDAPVTLFFGYTGFFLSVNLLSFTDLTRDLLSWHSVATQPVIYIYAWGLFAAALIAWLALIRIERRASVRLLAIEEWLCPIALIYAQVLALRSFYPDHVFVAGVFKTISAALAIMWMLRGSQTGSLKKTIVGSILFSLWIFARYFDLFDSLVSRGLAFLVLGAALFAEGFFYRQRRRVDAKGPL